MNRKELIDALKLAKVKYSITMKTAELQAIFDSLPAYDPIYNESQPLIIAGPGANQKQLQGILDSYKQPHNIPYAGIDLSGSLRSETDQIMLDLFENAGENEIKSLMDSPYPKQQPYFLIARGSVFAGTLEEFNKEFAFNATEQNVIEFCVNNGLEYIRVLYTQVNLFHNKINLRIPMYYGKTRRKLKKKGVSSWPIGFNQKGKVIFVRTGDIF
jgi:hypothetical protein